MTFELIFRILCFVGLAMVFTEGDEVLAKYPNTSEYYKGKILNVMGEKYKIQFESGDQHTVSEKDMKVIVVE